MFNVCICPAWYELILILNKDLLLFKVRNNDLEALEPMGLLVAQQEASLSAVLLLELLFTPCTLSLQCHCCDLTEFIDSLNWLVWL